METSRGVSTYAILFSNCPGMLRFFRLIVNRSVAIPVQVGKNGVL